MMVEESRIIQDADRLRDYIEHRFGKPADVEPAKPPAEESYASGYCNSNCSDYPLAWLKNRLQEQGYFNLKLPFDEAFPELFIADEHGKAQLLHVHFARSKIFSTMLLPRPIDITAARVSVCLFSDSHF